MTLPGHPQPGQRLLPLAGQPHPQLRLLLPLRQPPLRLLVRLRLRLLLQLHRFILLPQHLQLLPQHLRSLRPRHPLRQHPLLRPQPQLRVHRSGPHHRSYQHLLLLLRPPQLALPALRLQTLLRHRSQLPALLAAQLLQLEHRFDRGRFKTELELLAQEILLPPNR